MKNSIITKSDSYKFSMFLQYPPGTTHLSSYIESRGGEDQSVFFGIQAFCKRYLTDPITKQDIDFAETLIIDHCGYFNRVGWDIILDDYNGYLPIIIQAVPEGTVMETHNVQVQVTCDDPRLFWLVSYLETALLRAIWYPSTVATKSRKLKKVIAVALNESSDVPVMDQLLYKLHDFGARGTSSSETAELGGMAHLVNFRGTDTFESIIMIMEYYNTDKVMGHSIAASEHSTIISWGKEHEVDAFSNMIDKFAGPGKIYACVSDSFNIWEATTKLWGEILKDKIISSGGTLVVRPDSGDPTIVPIEVIKLLGEKFGYTVNSKGYKVLPPYIRVIQGDGINEETLPIIIHNLLLDGWSLDNLTFGMGGGLLQAWNRDSLKYAMKASAIRINGRDWIGISKDPITDHGKKSKEGRLGLVIVDGVYKTVSEDEAGSDNLLRTIFSNGKLLIEDTFETIRARAELSEKDYVNVS